MYLVGGEGDELGQSPWSLSQGSWGQDIRPLLEGLVSESRFQKDKRKSYNLNVVPNIDIEMY